MLQGTYRTLRAFPYPRILLSFFAVLVSLSIVYSSSTTRLGTNYIQSSPYASQEHLLDLNTLTKPHALLAQALQRMKPTSESYAVTPYKVAFNWQEVIDNLSSLAIAEGFDFPKTKFYVIVFRSQIEPGTNREELGALDKEAHKEAVESGWLLKYWFGVPNADGYNLATCIWRDIEDAKKGGSGKGHRNAMRAVQGFYIKWEVERLALVVGEKAKYWDIVGWGNKDADDELK